ncbi:uncharacterized protein LOC112511853 isoform X2 [Cynara cardunculus var. scolymus]|uniref:AT3G52170-like helix-turn-helix domain-containing protein n=1 Tax=Cynara cardunculus var. scolymus TaxID=59895 RepID=A0A103YIF4_CYNCS|nr:uncharacterized protein LOC112511853 isoform X2 [Cynara cardunculus var. scolymus]KVI09672.1 hypothetical protein Ccrd_011948 [Cynara cardunculus var. scolymus]
MQVTKGGCVGKTFALAKLNDSTGGKKSKRRSKLERKGMVETFIKRYQASNNGSFPSLHLTHKQVGGSYYTVREIFRELIQENRVLAPPKLPPGEQNMENLDSFLENYPLGSISFDPNIHVLPPKNNQTLLNEYEFRREKVLNSRRISELHRGSVDNDNIINGSNTTVKNEEFEEPRHIVSNIPEAVVVETSDATLSSEEFKEPKHTELLMEQALEVQKDEIKVEGYEAQIRPLAEDVVVETFPLRPVSSTVYNPDEDISEKEVLDGDLEMKTGKDEGFVRDEIHMFDDLTEVVDTKLEEELPLPESKPTSILRTHNHSSPDENIVLDVNITDVTSPAENDKDSSIPNGIQSQNLDGNNSSSLQQSTFEAATTNKNKSDIQFCGSAQNQTDSATLKTINLESWEAAAESKKSHIQETNPIVSFIQTAVAAFMKLWSE